MAGLVVGTIASLISVWLGVRILGFSPEKMGWMILASNLAAWVCLPTILMGERVSWFKRYVIPDWYRTWGLFVTGYFGILLGLVPELRALKPLVWLVFPLIFSTGFMIFMYGPIHDFFIARSQRNAKVRARLTIHGSPPSQIRAGVAPDSK